MASAPGVSICVLVFGDHTALAKQCLNSIVQDGTDFDRQIIVGANSPSPSTATFLDRLRSDGLIDQLIISPENIKKCPMMARMLERADHELVWWFDDDSHIISPKTMDRWVNTAIRSPKDVVQWGQLAWCDHPLNFSQMNEPATLAFVRAARWYQGLPPPSWRPGGKGEFDYHGQGTGNGRWYFITGGCWMARKSSLAAMHWPDLRLEILGEDVFMGEAIRQQGWKIANTKAPGVRVNDHNSREPESSDHPLVTNDVVIRFAREP